MGAEEEGREKRYESGRRQSSQNSGRKKWECSLMNGYNPRTL